MIARRKKESSRRQTTLNLQQLIDRVAKTGQTPTQISSRRGHRTVAERRKQAFAAFCRRRDEWDRFQGNYVVPDEKGTVIACSPVESLARAAGAAHLHWKPASVVVIPFGVPDDNADELALALATEFSRP